MQNGTATMDNSMAVPPKNKTMGGNKPKINHMI